MPPHSHVYLFPIWTTLRKLGLRLFSTIPEDFQLAWNTADVQKLMGNVLRQHITIVYTLEHLTDSFTSSQSHLPNRESRIAQGRHDWSRSNGSEARSTIRRINATMPRLYTFATTSAHERSSVVNVRTTPETAGCAAGVATAATKLRG